MRASGESRDRSAVSRVTEEQRERGRGSFQWEGKREVHEFRSFPLARNSAHTIPAAWPVVTVVVSHRTAAIQVNQQLLTFHEPSFHSFTTSPSVFSSLDSFLLLRACPFTTESHQRKERRESESGSAELDAATERLFRFSHSLDRRFVSNCKSSFLVRQARQTRRLAQIWESRTQAVDPRNQSSIRAWIREEEPP